MPRPIGVEELAAWLVHPLIGVSAKEIALGTGGAVLANGAVTLPPLSAWFGEF